MNETEDFAVYNAKHELLDECSTLTVAVRCARFNLRNNGHGKTIWSTVEQTPLLKVVKRDGKIEVIDIYKR